MSDTIKKLQVFTSQMLAGFARMLLTVPVGEIPEVLQALAGETPSKVTPTKPAPKRATRPPKAKSVKRPPNKRSPQILNELTERIWEYLQKHPGTSMEGLSKALNKPSNDLDFPLLKLGKRGVLRKEGNRRGMHYFPLVAKAKPAPKKTADASRKHGTGSLKKTPKSTPASKPRTPATKPGAQSVPAGETARS